MPPYEVGLSGPGRLHDLFVTHEAMSPGEWKAGGDTLTIRYGFHPSPFGNALIMATPRGLAGLAFADPGEEPAVLADMQARWPKATYVEDRAGTAAFARRILTAPPGARTNHCGRAHRHRIRCSGLGGAAVDSARTADQLFRHRRQGLQPGGSARGRGPRSAQSISFVVPCHRVVAATAASPAITGASPASAPCWAGSRKMSA